MLLQNTNLGFLIQSSDRDPTIIKGDPNWCHHSNKLCASAVEKYFTIVKTIAAIALPGVPTTASQLSASVAGNVSSFLSGIRATFRQENVYVSTSTRPRRSSSINNNDG